MNVDQQELARQIIRERSSRQFATGRPRHPRTARVLRRIANRMDSTPAQ